MIRSIRRCLPMVLAVATLSACSQPRAIASASPPNSAIISYPNSFDRLGTTDIRSNPLVAVAGVNSRVLLISDYEHEQPVKQLLSLDVHGNLGLQGSVSSVSHRRDKYAIEPYRADARQLLDRTQVVSFHYRGESTAADRHIGFIAEDTPAAMSGSHHDQMNVNNTVAVELAAVKQLSRELRETQAKVRILEAEVATLRQHAYP